MRYDPGGTVTSRQAVQLLKRAGFLHDRTGRHAVYQHPRYPDLSVAVPMHPGDLSPGVAREIRDYVRTAEQRDREQEAE